MRVGVIGVGAMGVHHVRIYSGMDKVELVGIADVNEKKVKEIAKQYNTFGCTDYRELLKKDLDAVSIVVPTTLHKKVALDAIEHNINLLVEKPIADSIENAKEIINAGQDSGIKMLVGHIERFNPAVAKLKEILEKGLLGEVVSISAKRVGPYNPRIRDVGIIIDLGVHDIDIISYLYGTRALEVYAIAGKSIHSYEDRASVILYFGGNKAGVIDTNWLTPHKVRKLTVIGLEGVACLDYLDQTLQIHDKEWIRNAKIEKEEPLARELRHFVHIIENNENPLVSGEDGLYALSVALSAIKSYKKNKIIKVEL